MIPAGKDAHTPKHGLVTFYIGVKSVSWALYSEDSASPKRLAVSAAVRRRYQNISGNCTGYLYQGEKIKGLEIRGLSSVVNKDVRYMIRYILS